MIRNILKTFKINHWIKNLTVLVPLFFSMNFLEPNLWPKALIMAFAFCLISSAVYILNDLIDIEKDKLHPIKKNRPIASGKISKNLAIFLLIVLTITSCFLSIKTNNVCLIFIISYLILNIFYSISLKNIPLIDASCIAFGFILRIVSGCFAISVLPSPLIILMTFFISMFFTFTKRKLELSLIKDSNNCRNSIKDFDITTANQFITINAVLSIAFYFTYVLDSTTIERAGTQYLYLTTIPFTLLIFRLLFLISTTKIIDDPIHFIENDKTIKWLILSYFLVLILVMTTMR